MEGGEFSILNGAASINFEIPKGVLLCRQDAEEEDEADQDEYQKEKELKDLLQNAFDDLIDGDDISSEEHSRDDTGNFDGCGDGDHDTTIQDVPAPLERVNYDGPRHLVAPHSRNPMILDKGALGEGHLYQLQILYSARGRELERLQQELDSTQEHLSRETQTLKHNLDVVMAEKEGLVKRFNELENELTNMDKERSGFLGQINAQAYQIQSISESKDELQSKLHLAESTIESLQHEIKEMTRSESISRARQQHAAFVKNLQERHKAENFELQQQVDQFKEALNEKTSEIISLRKDLAQAVKDLDALRMEKAETVNRLTRALDESQKIMNSGTAQEIQELRAKLKQAEESQVLSKKLVVSLQEEVKTLTSELELYGKRTPQNVHSVKTPYVQNEHLLHNLKDELERSLVLLHKKKCQISQLQEELQSSQQESMQSKKREQEAIAKQAAAEKQTKTEIAQEISSLLEIKTKLEAQSKHMEGQLSQARSNEAAMKQQLRDLERKYEESKRNAVGDAQTACMNIHETAMQAAKEEINSELQKCHRQYQSQINCLVEEMDHVKTLYVKVCEEKDVNENNYQLLRAKYEQESQEWNSRQKVKVDAIQAQYDKKLQVEVLKAKTDVERIMEIKIQHLKEQWGKEQSLQMQEQTLHQIKQKLESVLGNQGRDSSDRKLDDYLEHIEHFEARIKETEELWKQKLADMERNMQISRKREVADVKAKLAEREKAFERLKSEYCEVSERHEKNKERAVSALQEQMNAEKITEMKVLAEKMKRAMEDVIEKRELAFRKYVQQLLHTAEMSKLKALEEMSLAKEKELRQKVAEAVEKAEIDKAQGIKTLEESLGLELANFLEEQRKQFVGALKHLKDSHEKEKGEMERNYISQFNALKERMASATPETQKKMLRDNVNALASNVAEQQQSNKVGNDLPLTSAFSQLKELLDQLSIGQKLHLEKKLQEMRDDQSTELKDQLLHAEIKLEQLRKDYKDEVESHQVTLSKYNALKEKARKHNRKLQEKECPSRKPDFKYVEPADEHRNSASATTQGSNPKQQAFASGASNWGHGLESYQQNNLLFCQPQKLVSAQTRDEEACSLPTQTLSQELTSLKESFLKSLDRLMPIPQPPNPISSRPISKLGYGTVKDTQFDVAGPSLPAKERRCSGSDC